MNQNCRNLAKPRGTWRVTTYVTVTQLPNKRAERPHFPFLLTMDRFDLIFSSQPGVVKVYQITVLMILQTDAEVE